MLKSPMVVLFSFNFINTALWIAKSELLYQMHMNIAVFLSYACIRTGKLYLSPNDQISCKDTEKIIGGHFDFDILILVLDIKERTF